MIAYKIIKYNYYFSEYVFLVNVKTKLIYIIVGYNNTIFFIQDTFSLNSKRNGTND